MRQVSPQLFVFRIIGLFVPQASQCVYYFLLVHLERIGDHTRGLFEAEASIAVSTAHALENVQVLLFVCHPLAPDIHEIPEKPTR